MDNSYPAEIERLMEMKGFVKQRGTGVSVNALAVAVGIHVDTVSNILMNGRSSRPKNVQAVADALGVSSSELLAMAGREGGEVYVGPDATRFMTDRERAALTEFLLATLEKRKAGGERADSSASNKQAGESPAEEDDDTVHEADFRPGETDTDYYERKYGKPAHRKEKRFRPDEPLDEHGL